ncbi:HEAT repeat-containing protein 3-like isoform X1 [Huso huso]|uniref:HEAT repeat-containing protein 3-like isoform X1 n=1 Tax=Huso huso TaxID=61971 RepID=A0ABR0YWP5_HUSHU
MGKSKSRKFKRPQFSPNSKHGNNAGEEAIEKDEEEGEAFSSAGDLLEKLQSPSPDIREFACASISRLVQQTQVIPSFLQRDVVRCLGPMLLDKSFAVRETAAGALRNLSACGGFEVCDDMVKQDIMTPLVALLKECSAGFHSNSVLSPKSKDEQKNYTEDVANEAINLLWNVCESSSRAVSVFSKEGLLDVVMSCLERHSENVELAVSAAYCLQTVTEDNPELLCRLTPSSLQVLESVMMSSQSTMEHLLLRTLAAGCVWNLKSALPSSSQAETLSAVMRILSNSLEVDAGQAILELKEQESRRREEGKEREVQPCSDRPGEEMGSREGDGMEEGDEETGKPNTSPDNDISDLLPPKNEEVKQATALLSAQQTSLEIIVNMCCSDDPSDDEWEELSSSDESDMCAESSLCECSGVQVLSPLCLSAEIHTALISFLLPEKLSGVRRSSNPLDTDVDLLPGVLITVRAGLTVLTVFPRMHQVQCRALFCLHNMLSVMEGEALGGVVALQALAEHLSQLVFSQPEIPKEDEFLEAVTSAVRSLLQIMASRNIPQCMSPQQLIGLCEAAAQCSHTSVRVNAIAILGITGSTLAKQHHTADKLQMIGSFLLQVATKDPSLVGTGEALDALFDVFADGVEAERAARHIKLLPALRTLQPVFKAKMRKEGREKYSPDQLCVLDNVKVNLRRFISYLETLEKKPNP